MKKISFHLEKKENTGAQKGIIKAKGEVIEIEKKKILEKGKKRGSINV